MRFFKNLPCRRQLIVGLATLSLTGLLWAAISEVSLTGSNFEIDTDANLTVDDTGDAMSIDWASEDGDVQPDANSGSSDDSFGQGSKEDTEDPAVVSGSIPPNKSDLLTFGIYPEITGSGARFVHMFWHRVQEPNGTTNMDFEFNQSDIPSTNGVTPERTARDLLIQYDLANGGTVPELFLSRWIDGSEGETSADCQASNVLPCWNARTNLTASGDATGSINESLILAADALVNGSQFTGGNDISPRTFGEASIDFSALVPAGTGPNECVSYGSAYLKSRSSDSFTAALKDFIAPLPINISNCASLIITKIDDQVDPVLLQSAEFTLYKDEGGTSDLQCTSRVGGTQSQPDSEDSLVDTGTTGINGKLTFSGLLEGWYWLEETKAPINHDLPDSPYWCFEIVAGSNIEMDIENPRTPGRIIIEKQTYPDGDSTDFDFTRTGSGYSTGFTLADGEQEDVMNLAPGSYSATESGETGWDLTDLSCSVTDNGADGVQDSSATPSGSTANITLAAGETVKCTFTNTKRGTIIVDKVTLPAGDAQLFTFNPSWTGNFQLADATAPHDSGALAPGDYSVSETTLAGWDLTDTSCVSSIGDTESAAALELDAGETITCTFTNTKRGRIIVEKQTNPDGDTTNFEFTRTGTGYDTEFTLADNGQEDVMYLAPGSYGVTETAETGWDLADLSCSVTDAGADAVTDSVATPSGATANITLAAGETVKCTYTNTKRGAILITKTRKHAAAGGTGPHAGVDFTITGDGLPSGGTVVTTDGDGKACLDNLFLSSTYTVKETVPTGYVSDASATNDTKSINVTQSADCGANIGKATGVSFVNLPLTKITVTVDSLIEGGTASTITCKLGTTVIGNGATAANGDGSLTLENLEPNSGPANPYICEIYVDP